MSLAICLYLAVLSFGAGLFAGIVVMALIQIGRE